MNIKMKIITILVCSIISVNGFMIVSSYEIETNALSLETKANDTEYWAVVVSTFNEKHVYDALTNLSKWDISHIKFLYKENATKDNIMNALDWLIQQSDSDDIVLFADNSHGTRQGLGNYGIVPWDKEESGIISVEELDEKFDKIQCDGMCLIFDCCLAGNFVTKSNIFYTGLQDDNRVILMGTQRWGLGFHMQIRQNSSGLVINASFSRFIADALFNKVDPNNDGSCSAEEVFYYAKNKWIPFAILGFFMPRLQLTSLLNTGFLVISFPKIFDSYQGELSLSDVLNRQ